MTDQPSPPRRRRRTVLLVVAAVLLLIVIALVYLGIRAWSARQDLETARGQAAAARAAVLDGDAQQAVSAAASARRSAASARSTAHDPIWAAAAAIPWIGSPLASSRDIADVVSDFSADVLDPTADLATVVDPNTLRTGDTGIDTTLLAQNETRLSAVAVAAERIDARAHGLRGSWLGPVSDARDELARQTRTTARFLRGTDVAAKLLPPMLGGAEDRRYFLAFQTPAESRATGGLLGAYAVFSARRGRVTTDDLGPNSTLRAPGAPIDLGPEFTANYGISRPYTDSRNSNVSPHFPYAAQIWMSMWQQQSGERLDGAVATDPIALSYLLAATGPIRMDDGEQITGDNVVEITLSSSYRRFGGDNAARKAYLQQIASKAIVTLTTARGNTGAVLEALGRAVHERRLMVYSTRDAEQRLLVDSGLAHEVTETPSPYAQVTVGNLAGNKIDYYLRRTIAYEAAACTGRTRRSTVTLTLRNTVSDLSLPAYVIGGLGNPGTPIPPGTNFANVTLDATDGAVVQDVSVNGSAALYNSSSERGHLHVLSQVRVPPGGTATVVFTLTEPTSATGEAVVPVQPLVDDPRVSVKVPVCR